jgi:hypothetical protein
MTSTLQPTEKDFDQMMQMVMGYFMTQIAGAVATYSIADHLAKGPATAAEIATWEGINPNATYRLLRACASLGLVTYDGNRFAATSMLGTLRSDLPGSLHSLAISFSTNGHWQPWGRFADAVRTSSPQTIPALGTSIWEYFKQQPEEGATFTRAMHGFTSGIVEDVVRVVDTANTKLASILVALAARWFTV